MTFRPQAGLVVRYDYLWKSEHDIGRIDGAKDRPCAIILATKDKGHHKRSLLLCAITHSPPNHEEKAIEIPLKVARYLGLDHDRMWIKTHEVNIIEWQEGCIPCGISTTPKGEWSYGMLPQALGKAVFDQVMKHNKSRALAQVKRD